VGDYDLGYCRMNHVYNVAFYQARVNIGPIGVVGHEKLVLYPSSVLVNSQHKGVNE
jgi:hypothetical protein